MPEHIERAKAVEYFEKSKQVMWHKDDVAHTISEHVPTADVVEVRHGEWVTDGRFCSKCHKERPYMVIDGTTHYWQCYYCPNCGADMRGKKSGNE